MREDTNIEDADSEFDLWLIIDLLCGQGRPPVAKCWKRTRSGAPKGGGLRGFKPASLSSHKNHFYCVHQKNNTYVT